METEEKKVNSVFEIKHNPKNSNAIVIKEEKKYVLRKGIFGIAFLDEDDKKIEIKRDNED